LKNTFFAFVVFFIEQNSTFCFVRSQLKLVNALHNCDYEKYLNATVEVQPILLADRFLQVHCGYIMRELHVLGYKQFLDSYKSVTLDSMATSFGVGAEYLDLQLSRFISAGRLTAKIDKYGGVVETNRPDEKNAQYRDMIQKGDVLLNRIQKLARVVDL
jgi:26S proteasome regulatory subunit N7